MKQDLSGNAQSKKASTSIDTRYILFGQFGHRTFITLEEICTDFFGLSYRTAARRASVNELPVPVFKMGESQKSPWVVAIDELAEYIDLKSREARRLWDYSRV